MKKYYENVYETIGNTPLLKLNAFCRKYNIKADVFAKLECFNPTSSVKDRAAYNMIAQAEKRGLIDGDTVIIEPTSGNTGIGLASVCAQKGYKLILTMPNNMSNERRLLLSAFGAELVLTDSSLGMNGAIEKVEELKKKYKKVFVPNQFENTDNVDAHYKTTACEIYDALNGNIDAIVVCAGSGGTVSGIARYFKDKGLKTEIAVVEPNSSAVLSGDKKGSHKIQGIGAGFIPKNLHTEYIDTIIRVTDEEAYHFTREIAILHGILCGISSGATLAAVQKLATSDKYIKKSIVVIFPDSGERYLSTGVF